MKIPKELEGVVDSDPNIVSGQLRFVGTRVMVSILFDHLFYGGGIEEFLEGFPGVSREQAEAVRDYVHQHSADDLGIDRASGKSCSMRT
jgi:uncharacterized protein (DUF433 family)